MPRPPVTSRPVQWPESTSACGLSTALDHRRVIDGASIDSFEVHAGHHDVEALEQLGLLIERAVLEDVDLDAGEDRISAQPSPRSSSITSSCLRRRSGRQAVGDRQAGRVVGQRAVLVAQFPCRESSSPRSAPSRPTSSSAREGRRLSAARIVTTAEILCRRAQFGRRVGLLGPAHAWAMTFAVLGPRAGQRLPAVGRAVALAVGVAEAPPTDVGGVAVGHHPARVTRGR